MPVTPSRAGATVPLRRPQCLPGRPEQMRAVGLDLGQRRIGVAMTDAGGRLAVPYGVVERSGDGDRDRAALAAIVEEAGADVVVVGLPLSLSGRMGPAAEAAAAEAATLGEVLAVPVVTFDERLTTVEAARRRRERAEEGLWRPGPGGGGGQGRHRRSPKSGGSSRRPRPGIDAEAAAIMLEAWLAAER